MDQSPRGLSKGRGKGTRRPRKSKVIANQIPGGAMAMGQSTISQPGMQMQGVQGANSQVPSHMGAYNQGASGMQQGQQYPTNTGQQQWYNQQQSQQQQQPQAYYPQQMANGRLVYYEKLKVLQKKF